jgi:phosphate starvation-inducible PhoH-like protein
MTKKKTPRDYRQEELIPNELEVKAPNFKIKQLKFKSQKQKDFFDLCRDDDIKLVICDGPAGTGKSLLALYAALKLVKSGKYDRIMYVRTPVDSSDGGIGYLPGDINDKIINYMIPLDEKLNKLMDYDDIKDLYSQDYIEYTVNSFMRGRSIENTILIIDEFQNQTMKEAITCLSRIEESSKIIAIGDHMQSDIGLKSCLTKVMSMFHDRPEAVENGVATLEFNNDDIVRSKLVKYIVGEFERAMKMSRGGN